MAELLSRETQVSTIALDGNPSQGAVSGSFGLTETLSVLDLVQAIEAGKIATASELTTALAQTLPGGLHLVGTNSEGSFANVSGREYENLLKWLKPLMRATLVDAIKIVDGKLGLAQLAESDAIILVGNAQDPESLASIGRTMAAIRAVPRLLTDDDRSRSPKLDLIADLVDHAIVVITNIPRGRKLFEFYPWIHVWNQGRLVSEYPSFDGVFVPIWRDKRVDADGIVDYESLKWRTHWGIREALIWSYLQRLQVAKVRDLRDRQIKPKVRLRVADIPPYSTTE